MVQALNQALIQAFEKDSTVVTLGEDVGIDGGVFRVSDGLQQRFGKERVMDTGIAEAGIVGASLGMAINGLKPVAEIQFSGFIYPAFQQLISHVSRMRNRTRGLYTAPMVIRSPYGGGINALEHHSESLEALYAHIPGLKVVIPSSPSEAKGLLLASIADPDPVLFLEPKKLYRAFKEEVSDDYYEIEIGKAKVLQEGTDLTIIGWGAMIPVITNAIQDVQKSIEVIDLRTIAPWDAETVIKSVQKTGRAVILHEATKSGGFGAEIAATLQEECIDFLEAPIKRVTAPDIIVPFLRSEKLYRPNGDMLLKAIDEVMNY